MTDDTSAELKFFKDLGGDTLVSDVEAYEEFLKAERSNAAKPAQQTWHLLGTVVNSEQTDEGVRLACENGYVDVSWISQTCVCVRVRLENAFPPPFSYAVTERDMDTIPHEMRDSERSIVMTTDSMMCRIEKKTVGISLRLRNGRVLGGRHTRLAIADEGAVRLSVGLESDEASYGTGERAANLNLRGQRFTLWNKDQPNCDRGVDPLYYNVPFYVGLHDQGAYGIFWDNSARGTIDIGAHERDQLTFEAEKGELRYYLMGGETTQDVITDYMALTGTPPLPPMWYLGYHQSRFSYYPQEDVLELARKIREHKIPCDAIYLDIHYLDNYKVLTWDVEQFPDFAGMVAELHRMGFKVVPILDPAIKIEDGFAPYEDGIERDVFLRLPDGDPLRVVVWSGASHMPDFSKPEIHTWWSEHLEDIIATGVDGFWNDMNEPAVFTTSGADTLPDRTIFDKHGHGADHVEMHNTYGMLMATATQKALRKHRPEKRPVNVTRSGYAGAQRVTASWTGDVTADWDHLRMSIPMILNMGLSGVPFTGADVGGFRDDTDAELLTRWTQAACLMPFFRNHSAIDTIRQEPWVFGEPYEQIMRQFIELRYRLMPYLYSVAAVSAQRGLPMIRPMFMVDESDAKLRDVHDQFMLGDALLVAPVMEPGATERTVTLPKGQWYNFGTGQAVPGKS